MNILFLTMASIKDINVRLIYTDLLRVFVSKGHHVYIVSPRPRRMGEETNVKINDAVTYLGVRTLNLQKSTIIEKGVGQILVERQFKNAIKKYLPKEKYDLILYSTPPITFAKVISFLKRNNPDAKTYLLLKDIFPQNAVDIGMMTKSGIRGLLYYYFRKKEKKLYALSDYIGCMSPANVDYVLNHNPEVDKTRVEIAPNSIEIKTFDERDENEQILKAQNDRYYIRSKYNLPLDRPIFIYGGNLGKPQGISFLIECLNANKNRQDCYFVVIGTGTEFSRLKKWYIETNPQSVVVLNGLPKIDYDEFVSTCDVGMIFLDHRFTIPNYPSRLLSYLENKMPIICATDPNTDIGRIAEANGYGFWCESNSVTAFTSMLEKMIHSNQKEMGERGYSFLKLNYLVENTYNVIMRHL